jgi:hypothetical protein
LWDRRSADSAGQTLYRVEKSKSTPIAKGVAPNGFTINRNGSVIVWNDAVRRLQQLSY